MLSVFVVAGDAGAVESDGAVAAVVASSACACPAKKNNPSNTNTPNNKPRRVRRTEHTCTIVLQVEHGQTEGGSDSTLPRVLPQCVDVAVTEPLLLCVTFVVLELLDDAAPVETVAVDEPVLDPVLVFEAVPPAFPAEFVEPVPPEMLPSDALESAVCRFVFTPTTAEPDEL